jgi:hypothetical protein
MIILNADDFALSDEVDAAVIDLACRGRLSAASVMANQPRWPAAAAALLPVADRIALGLHLTLTEGAALSPEARADLADASGHLPPLGRVLMRALTARISPSTVAAEARAQLSAFADALGRLPDIIDGHQHVHVLPGVRDGLIAAIADFEWPTPPLIRTPSDRQGSHEPPRDGLASLPKRRLIAALAGGFRRRLAAAGLPTNDTFAGFSSFHPGPGVATELASALAPRGAGRHIVMCHPAVPAPCGHACADPLAPRRADEYRALLAMPDLPARLWRPPPTPGRPLDWPEAAA